MANQSPEASVAAGLVALRALNAPLIRCISLSSEPGGLSGVGAKAALETGAGLVIRLAESFCMGPWVRRLVGFCL